jgi:DNA invertase Pin-like site-specific DNA recombinase
MKYILYCRKSTDTEDKQVLSLESQENELRSLAEAHNLEIVEVLKESKSAKEPGRPVFDQMLKTVASGKADAILCWKIDRLTRNPVDGGQIQWLLQTNKIKCIRTFEKSFYPNDNVLLMSIEQAMANQYIRDLSMNVKRGNREKLNRGEWPNHAPFGYLNDRATKTIVIDPIRSKYVPRAFELYLTGSHGFQSISDTLYKEGLRTRTDRKVLVNHIQRILSCVFYTGIMERDGKYYQGKHQALISKTTYDLAQDVMHGRSHPRPQRLFFPLRGFLKCENCGCA